MSCRKDIRYNKAARVLVQQMADGELLVEIGPDRLRERVFLIGDSEERYSWGAVCPLVGEGLAVPVAYDAATDRMIYGLTDAGQAYARKRANTSDRTFLHRGRMAA